MLAHRFKQALKAFFIDRPLGKPVELGEEPHFLFVITPPYSGSTALAQILRTAPGTAFLEERAEGQWLVPGMGAGDRWNPDKKVDWEAVRFVWLRRVAMLRALAGNLELVIEKSPPNMVRVDRLTEAFPRHTLLAFNRDPFANSASILYRLHDPERKSEARRVAIVRGLAQGWLDRSAWVKKWIDELGVLHFTYEDFCADPERCLGLLSAELPLLAAADATGSISVKDYGANKLTDHNARQTAKLRPAEIEAIEVELAKQSELVEFFGYDALGPPR